MSFILIVGAGRVGSAVARTMLAAGHEVSVLDEDPLSHERLDVGHGHDVGGRRRPLHASATALEIDALREAGIEEADVFIASTDGDNTNLDDRADRAASTTRCRASSCRVMDPARAEWYAEQGLHTICPTSYAIEMFERGARRRSRARMYVVIAGGGKVGWNLARELMAKGHEVTLIESDRPRYLTVEQELEHAIQYGDATELWVLERAGIQRADLVDRGHRRRRGQPPDLPDRQGEVPLRADHRARQQPAQPPVLRAARHPAGRRARPT